MDRDIEKYESMLGCLKDKFHNMVECGANQNMSDIDTKELGEVVDMLKDTYEACYYLNAAKYYCAVTEAMEDATPDEIKTQLNRYEPETREWYGGRRYPRYYTNRARDSRGRYMYDEKMPMLDYGYDPMVDGGAMYYFNENEHWPRDRYYYGNGVNGNSQSGSYGINTTRDPREGRSGMRRRMYMESKEKHDVDKQHEELEKYLAELSEDMGELIEKMEPNEKAMLKSKMVALANKIN